VPADCVGTLSDEHQSSNVAVLNCSPVSIAPAPLAQTGQTLCYSADGSFTISCAGTGQDGELRKGVVWPSPRFTNNGNGTATDNLTGLIWLTNTNCIHTLNTSFDIDGVAGDGMVTGQHALNFVAGINAGTYNCDDTSNGGAQQTDWRLPNVRELYSLLDLGKFNPSLPAGHPFMSTINNYYWSSTTVSENTDSAWGVDFGTGKVASDNKELYAFVTAVRAGL